MKNTAGKTESFILEDFLDSFTSQEPDDEDKGALLDKLLTFVRRSFGMEVAFISEFDQDHRTFRHVSCDHEFQPIHAGEGGPLEESYCLRVVRKELPELIVDARQLPLAFEIPATRALPIGSHLSVPLYLTDGSLYGTFCCFSRSVVPGLANRELEFMHLLGGLAARFISAEVIYQRQQRLATGEVMALLEADHIDTYEQPINVLVDADGVIHGRPYAYEALARFPDSALTVEDIFIKGEQTGLSLPLQLRCLMRALDLLRVLPSRMLLSVNVSASVLIQPQTTELLEHYDLSRVVIELTERESVLSYIELLAVVTQLRKSGARLAVDDAGAGYSSLRHIMILRPEWIKLDRSLVANVDKSESQQALIRSMVNYGADMDVVIIAEGIETTAELNTLFHLGVRYGQGYLISRPREAKAG